MSDLPQGWTTTSLGEIGKWSSGGTPSRRNSAYFGKGVPWVKSGDLPDGRITATEEKITQVGLKNSSAKVMPVGTISLALYGATIGKLGVMTFPAATNQACANVIPDFRLIDPQYLFFYLMSEREALIEKGQGGAQPNISQQIVKAHDILLAPVNEQRRIVVKLENLLGRVNAAQERLATIPHILKRFRQSVIDSASLGALTVDWRADRGVEFEQFSGNLGNLARFIDYRGKTPRKTTDGIPLITAKNIRPGYLSIEPREYIAESDYDIWMTRGIPEVGDVLITTEAPLGYVVCIDWTFKFALAQRVICLHFDKDTIIGEYASLVLQSTEFQSQLRDKATGTTVTGIKASRLKELPINFPSIDEQKEIVRRVDALLKSADPLQARYLKAKELVDKLTQSILAKAFRGELVPQDPNDEPASVLLERIRRERNGSPVTKRRSRK
jgi:type I restriction enzyme S subunit